MYRHQTSDPPQSPFKLSKHNLTGGTEPVWTATLPHVQVGSPIEFDDKMYVPLGKVVAAPTTANKTLCWVEIEPSLLGDPEVGTPVDVEYEVVPVLTGDVIGGDPVDNIPTGGRLGHIHPSCFLGIHSGTLESQSRLGGFYASMLSAVIGGHLYAIPYAFACNELLMFKPAEGEPAWRLQGWDEGDLWREIYAPLLITGERLLVHYERWEYEAFEDRVVFDGEGIGSTIDAFLLKVLPEDSNEDNIGDAYSVDGFGWGDLRYWVDGVTDLTQSTVLNHPVSMGTLEAIADRVGDFIQALLDTQTFATSKLPTSRRQGFREYDVAVGTKLTEKAIEDRGPCVKDLNNNPCKHRNSYYSSWRLVRYKMSQGLSSYGDLPGFDTDRDEVIARVAVAYGNDGSGAGQSSLDPVRTAFVIDPPLTSFDDTHVEAIYYIVVRRKTWVTCETSKRLPYRTYDVACDATRYVWSPGLQRAHAQTISTTNEERDREEGGGGGGGGGGGFG